MSKRAVRFLRGGRRSGSSKPPSEPPVAAESTNRKASDSVADLRDRETVPEGMLHRAQVPPRPPSLESLESEQVEGSFDDTPEPDAATAKADPASIPAEPALQPAPSAVLEPEPEPAPAAAAGESDSRPTQPEPAIVKASAAAAQLPLEEAQPEEVQPEPPAVDAAVSELATSSPDHRHEVLTTLEPQAHGATLEPQAHGATLDPKEEAVAPKPKGPGAALAPKTPLAAILLPPAPAVSELEDTEPASPSRDRLPGDRSLSPITNDTDPDEEDEGAAQEISPETLVVRARLRRIVGAGLGLLVAGIAAGAISMAASKNRTTADAPAAARSTTNAAAERSLPAPAPPEVATDKAPDVAGSAEVNRGAPGAPTAGEPANVEKARALNAKALDLLKRRKSSEAVPVARAAIEADPDDALSYLYLGSALQDMGRWKDAMSAYDACVKRATRGMVDECRAMGGQKKK
jgi:hypothetical protein